MVDCSFSKQRSVDIISYIRMRICLFLFPFVRRRPLDSQHHSRLSGGTCRPTRVDHGCCTWNIFWSFCYFLKQLIDNGRSARRIVRGLSRLLQDCAVNPSIHAADIRILSLTSINIWIFISFSLYTHAYTQHTHVHPFALSFSFAFSLSLSFSFSSYSQPS